MSKELEEEGLPPEAIFILREMDLVSGWELSMPSASHLMTARFSGA